MLKFIATFIAIICLLLAATALSAAESAVSKDSASVLDYLTDKDGKTISKYSGPTVEDNVKLMDADKNGFADVLEVRAFLQLKHGNDYQKEMLDRWEASAYGKSCSSPFAKELYSDKNY